MICYIYCTQFSLAYTITFCSGDQFLVTSRLHAWTAGGGVECGSVDDSVHVPIATDVKLETGARISPPHLAGRRFGPRFDAPPPPRPSLINELTAAAHFFQPFIINHGGERREGVRRKINNRTPLIPDGDEESAPKHHYLPLGDVYPLINYSPSLRKHSFVFDTY